MDFHEIVKNVVPYITVAGLIYIGMKLQLLSHLDRTAEKMKKNIKVIADALIKSDVPFENELLESYSPLHLTDKGKQYLDKIGFVKLFSEHSQDFFDCINDEETQTEYDIENSAIRCVFFLFDKPYFNEVKNYLYNNPNEDKKELIKVAGIYVRDKYTEQKSS